MIESDLKRLKIEEFRNQKYIPNLDGLRAISILLVLLHHVPKTSASFLQTLQENGRFGVSLFFVISGFLIYSLFLREERKTGEVSLKNFYIRRSLRLFPLYYLILGIESFLVLGLNVYSSDSRQLFLDKLPSYLFYYSNIPLTATEGPFFIAWSLAAEEQFYLIFGILFVFCSRSINISLLLILLLIKPLLLIWYPDLDRSENLAFRIFLSYQEPIFIGVLLAYVLDYPITHKWFRWLFGNTISVSLIWIIFFLFIAFFPIDSRVSLQAQLLYFLQTLLVGSCALHRSLPLIGGSLMSHIGKISYGMYLMHMIVFNVIKRFTHTTFTVLFIGVPCVIGLATLSYRYFEGPFLSLKKRFSKS